MEHALARNRFLTSLRRKLSDSATSTTPREQRPREEKSAPYRDPRYKTLLATKGSFMDKSDLSIAETRRKTCHELLSAEQEAPKETLFRDNLFEKACRSVEERNEARILRDIAPLIIPWAEILATYGSTSLKCLIESKNEGWNNSIPLTGIRPQPDNSLGFRRETFTDRFSPLSRTTIAPCGFTDIYPVIDGKDTKYYLHPIHAFNFPALDGKDKWTAYRFTKNVYDTWMPVHLKRICSAIDQLPSSLDFDVQAPSESTGLSQDLGGQLALREVDPELPLADIDG